MGQNLSQKQSPLQVIAPFQNMIDEVNSVKSNPTVQTPGEALYKKYETQCMNSQNPLRFYNNFRLFYNIRKMQYSVEEMNQMQQNMQQFDNLTWEYFNTYQKTIKNSLFTNLQTSQSTQQAK